MIKNRFKGRIFYVIREPHGQDHMIEPSDRRSLWRDRVSCRVDGDVERFNPNLLKHGAQERGFILAVPIFVTENVRRRMRLPASYPQLDGYVSNIFLHGPCE